MKKLMTMIAAVATSFGLFAAAPLPTDNSESFAEATVGETITTGSTTYWGWNGESEITTAEAVVEAGTPVNVLAIKTGAKTLSRKLEKDESAYAIVSNMYFDTEINLMGQALDELPEVPADAKIAIFAYNNADDVEENPWTALYVLASDGNGGKMLYQLSTGIDITEEASHRLTVQTYKNILKDSENVGFKIFIDGGKTVGTKDAAFIEAAYAFDEETGKVVWTDVFSQNNYLKGKVLPQFNSVRRTLFVGLLDGQKGQTLTKMDFIGNAKIANIEINESGFDFIAPDKQLMSLVLNDVTVVADPEEALDADNNILDDCTLTITPATGKTVVKYSYGEGETLLTGNTLDVTMVPGTTLTITAYAEPATVIDAESGEPIEGSPFTSFAEALDAANGYGAECILKLAADLNADTEFTGYIDITGTVVLNLMGKTITGSGNEDDAVDAVINNTGTLTIVDNVGGGKILPAVKGVGAVRNGEAGDLTIVDGIFDGAVFQKEETEGDISALGGEFLKDAMGQNEVAALIDDLYKDSLEVVDNGKGYWVIQERVINYVAQIGDDKYETFEEAVAALTEDGQTIELIDNATLTTKVTPAFSTTFDMGGFTLDAKLQKAITCSAGKTLNVTNGTITIQDTSYTFEVYGMLNVLDGARIVKADANGPVFDVYDGATINVEDGAYISNGNGNQTFRFKDEFDSSNCTYTVNVKGGTIDGTGANLFDVYKPGATATIAISGGTINATTLLRVGSDKEGKTDSATANLTISGGTINATTANFSVVADSKLNLTLNGDCKAKFKVDQGLNDYCADGFKAFKAEGADWYTIVEAQLYVANLFVDGQPGPQIELGTDGEKFAKGEKVVATKPGVIDDTVEPDFAKGKTYYVEKLVLFGATEDEDKVCEFEYDGTTLTKKGDDGIGVDLQGNILTYTVETGDLNPFGAVYVKEYVAAAPDPADDDPAKIDPSETAATRYGERVPAKLADVSAKELCEWAQGNGELKTGEEIKVEAFLFNIANASDAFAVKAEEYHFAFTSITAGVDPVAGKDIPDTNLAGDPYNGTVLVSAFADAACTIPQMPGPQEAVFYKATLNPTPAPAPAK